MKIFIIERNVKKFSKIIKKLLKQYCFVSEIKFIKQVIRFFQIFNK